jgi:hypothetical protein
MSRFNAGIGRKAYGSPTDIHFWRGNVNPQVKLSAPKRVVSCLS